MLRSSNSRTEQGVWALGQPTVHWVKGMRASAIHIRAYSGPTIWLLAHYEK